MIVVDYRSQEFTFIIIIRSKIIIIWSCISLHFNLLPYARFNLPNINWEFISIVIEQG